MKNYEDTKHSTILKKNELGRDTKLKMKNTSIAVTMRNDTHAVDIEGAFKWDVALI